MRAGEALCDHKKLFGQYQIETVHHATILQEYCGQLLQIPL
jgi:hypothetical protein